MTSADFFSLADLTFEILQRACLALAMVIFVRRVRYGGRGRAVEVLLVFCAMPALADWERWLCRMHSPWQTGSLGWWAERTADFACPTAFVAYVLVRKQISGWASLALLGFAMQSFWAGDSYLLSLPGELAYAMSLSKNAEEVVLEALMTFSVGMIYGVPAAQILFARSRIGWTWVDWTGAALAAPLLLISTALDVEMTLNQVNTIPPSPRAVIPAAALSFVLALTLCVFLASHQRSKTGREHCASAFV